MTKPFDAEPLEVQSADDRRALRESQSHSTILTGVRKGGPAELRRALVLVESGNLSLGTVRGTVGIRLRESIGQRGLPSNIVGALKTALGQLDHGEEVHVPFSPNGLDIEIVCVPFSIND